MNDNKLEGDDLNIIVKQCPNLRKIKLENNNIKNVNNLKKLAGLNIKKINLRGNPLIKDNPDYKNKLFDIFLSLISIDGTDKEENDIESSEYENEQNILEPYKFITNCVENKEKNEKNESNNNSEDYDDYLYEENIDGLEEEEEEEEEDDDDDNDNNENNENIDNDKKD